MTKRWILHADMDAFYASIEQRDNPALRGKPVIVGATSARGVVAAASYEARKFGVRSAMPGFEARRLCPEGIYVRPSMERYQQVSQEVHAIFEEVTPEIEPLALDEAFLDVTASVRLFGGPEQLARYLKRRVREQLDLTISVGMAGTKLVAKIACAASKPDGLCLVPASQTQDFLDPLPVGRLWGVGPVLREKLEGLGIRTVRDLRTFDEKWLRRSLKGRAAELQRMAAGEDLRPVQSERAPKSIGEENTFEEDVDERDVVADFLLAHSEEVARRLRRAGYVCTTVTLKVKLARRRAGAVQGAAQLYPQHTRARSLTSPTADGLAIYHAVLELWDILALDEPVRLLGVSASNLSRPGQLDLFDQRAGRTNLGSTLDAIQDRFGRRSIGRAVEAPTKVTPSLVPKRGG